jgi:hypothetical protein
MPSPHEQLIARAAKMTLGPLGFRRKGQSCIWISDQKWWLNIVEFQPSAWARGSFLNVNAHCLWSENDYISYEYGGRIEPFSEFETNDQFEGEAERLARSAAQAADLLKSSFESIEVAASTLAANESELPVEAKGSWPAYHAGVALGLAGKPNEAEALFHSVRDERVLPIAARLGRLIRAPDQFRLEVEALIATHRTCLGLAPAL